MKSDSLDGILKEMDILKRKFTNCRAYFPYVTDAHIGARGVVTAPYYINRGFKIGSQFDKPLAKKDIQKMNEIGHYMNQNFIVRLYAMLESYGLISNKTKIDKSIDGWKELDLVRRLRGRFAHTSGKYNPSNRDQKKLVDKLISHFKLSNQNPQDFPLSIDEVIDPLFEGCKQYIKDKFQKNIKQGEQNF